MFGVMQHLKVSVCKDAMEAIEKGHVYNQGVHKAVEIEQVVIVQDGTVGRNATVDFVLVDEQGNKYVVAMTANLLKALPL